MDEFPKIPDAVLLIVPEAIARETCILPFEASGELLSLYYPADLTSTVSLDTTCSLGPGNDQGANRSTLLATLSE